MDLELHFNVLRSKLSKFVSADTFGKATLPTLQRMLLIARDELPDDPQVFEIFQQYVLRPITKFEREFFRASRRVCLIDRTNAGPATGILVGADLLLTAAHGLRGTRSPTSVWADPSTVTLRFDEFFWSDGTRADSQKCGIRAHPITGDMVVLASSVRVDPSGASPPREGDLDYVLVELDRPIGMEPLPRSSRRRLRGWMDGSAAEVAPTGDVSVLQHPSGALLQVSRGNIGQGVPAGRFNYEASVIGGASGAPILNSGKLLVGMHVGEEELDRRAIGVSFQAIFRDLKKHDVTLPRYPPRTQFLDELSAASGVRSEHRVTLL